MVWDHAHLRLGIAPGETPEDYAGTWLALQKGAGRAGWPGGWTSVTGTLKQLATLLAVEAQKKVFRFLCRITFDRHRQVWPVWKQPPIQHIASCQAPRVIPFGARHHKSCYEIGRLVFLSWGVQISELICKYQTDIKGIQAIIRAVKTL